MKAPFTASIAALAFGCSPTAPPPKEEPKQNPTPAASVTTVDIESLVELARTGGEILPTLEKLGAGLGADPSPASLGDLARLYHARAGHVASFSEDQSEALLTIACLLQRKAGPVAGLENAEAELDKLLGRFKTSGTPLIAMGEGWSFHDGDPFADEAWAGPDFDDTFWSVEDAPLGFARDGVKTETKPVTSLYLRRYFDIADAKAIKTLRAEVLRGDGIVALYLNGENVGGVAAVEPLAELTIDLPVGALRDGSNTFAAVIHRKKGGGEGMIFDLALTANLPSAANHLSTVDDSTLGTAIGKYWAALPAELREALLAPKPQESP